MATRLEGLEEVNRNLKRRLSQIGGDMTEDFVTAVVLQIRARSAAMTPVMTSNLINSAFHRVYATPMGYAGEMGYGAKYAVFVHEAPGALKGTNTPRIKSEPRWGNVWDPNGEPEFLKKGVEEMIAQDLSSIIARSYKI